MWLSIAVGILMVPFSGAQTTKKAPPKAPPAKASAPAKPAAAARPGAPAARPGAPGAANRPGAPGANHGGAAPAHNANAVATRGGGTREMKPGGGSEYHGAHGEQAKFDSKGHVREINSGNVHIQRGPNGARHAEIERPDHSRIVMDGHGRGYVQRPYMYGGHTYYNRTYYVNGVTYVNVYRPYYFNGVYLTGYAPAYYYGPGFYGWAYNPWPAPAPYAWGWGVSPWYGYYGAYFAPYPVYPSPAFWLTDYLIAASLQSAYAAGVAAGAASGEVDYPAMGAPNHSGAHLLYASYSPYSGEGFVASGTPALTPEIKQLISTEISADLAAEKAQAASGGAASSGGGLSQMLSDGKQHVFVVSSTVSATSAGTDCGLTDGDVLQTSGAAPAAKATTMDLTVLASKAQDCSKGAQATVKLEDLGEMENNLMSKVDQGLGEMAKNPGKGGLPAPPAADISAKKDAPYAAAAPADPNVSQELADGEKEANQTEQAVVSEAAPEGGDQTGTGASPIGGTTSTAADSSAAPVTIALGQTPAQVKAAKGAPKSIVNLGTKQIYIYEDMKIYFTAGKVTDVK
jgi:hypothetical protein